MYHRPAGLQDIALPSIYWSLEAGSAWTQKSQKSQKEYYDWRVTILKVRAGGRIFVYIPAEKTGKTYKFACPYKSQIEYFNYMTMVLKWGLLVSLTLSKSELHSIISGYALLRLQIKKEVDPVS